MFTEKLTLEVRAADLGWSSTKPPVLVGHSGVSHRFSFLASSGDTNHAFDIYEDVNELNVIDSFVKQLDTKAAVNLISTSGRATPTAEKLAGEYGMKILDASSISRFFDGLLVAAPRGKAL
jgi:hypothetical protein